uniref:Uncharacterized protein n=1 Tax=Romanomermis culicivorax TaxID=13658 RepID=A0A915JYV3_ROMCU
MLPQSIMDLNKKRIERWKEENEQPQEHHIIGTFSCYRLPHNISNASKFVNPQLLVTILPNEPQPKKSPANNLMDHLRTSHCTPVQPITMDLLCKPHHSKEEDTFFKGPQRAAVRRLAKTLAKTCLTGR